MKLRNFIEEFVPEGNIVRIWKYNERNTLSCLKFDEGDGSVFAWELLEEKVPQSKYLEKHVFRLPGICLSGPHRDALDIQIY